MDIVDHYPPELFQLLVDTIPRLVRSKRDQILFFRGAGVEPSLLADVEAQVRRDRDGINRYEIARTILTRLNERGEASLGERRMILRRVTEFEDYSRCWPNEVNEVRGLIARVREIVNVKDSFTRMQQEREAEAARSREARLREAEAVQARRAELKGIRDDLAALYAETNAHRRGKKLEAVLNRLFDAHGMLVREAFELTGNAGEGVVEQIDGAVVLDGDLYLVEMKWWKTPLGPMEVSQHLNRVFARADCRGIMISASGYTPAGINAYREALRSRTVLLCKLEEFLFALEGQMDIRALLRKKVETAILEKNPLSEPGRVQG
jgi:restriction system protein